jgi:histidyl-tRNA synthetase
LLLRGRNEGIDELRFICDNVTKLGLSSAILDLDVTLGIELLHRAIFEVAPKEVAMAPSVVEVGMI